MPRKPEFDREDLIDRARALFWKQGWAGTSMKDIEADLNIKPGSFYAAFGSKDALFELALDRYAQDSVSRLGSLAKAHGPLGALQALPSDIVQNEASPAKACMLSKTYLELQGRDHPLAERANAHLLVMEKEIAALFTQAQASGEISARRDPDQLARRYQSDLLGLRVTAERPGVDALAIAQEIAESLTEL